MPLDPHPLLQSNTGLINLPHQLLPLSEKDEEWGEACMDALEGIGRAQYYQRFKILENYKMLGGQFLEYQYQDLDNNEYQSLIQMAQRDFQQELHMRHFDFIGQIVNTMCGELEGHPDTLRAIAEGDTVDNARIREKGKLLQEYVNQQIQQEINLGLAQQGLDPDKDDFGSEEEQQQYSEQVEQAKKALTPEAIQQYISSDWKHVAEIWANITLTDAKKKYDLARKEILEFKDMLASDRCYRHFYLTGTGFDQETWNPIDVFHSQNVDQTDVEKGDYVGRTFYMSQSQVIDQFGHLLTGKELESLYGSTKEDRKANYKKDILGNNITYTSPTGTPYGVRVPWDNPLLSQLPQVSQTTSGVGIDQDILFGRGLGANSIVGPLTTAQYQVTQGYWKSQKKVGKLTWLNPETGVVEKTIVDETVVLPPKTKVLEGHLYTDTPEAQFTREAFRPTIEWTWINEIWGGIKIMPLGHLPGVDGSLKPLYCNVKPLPFQGKPDAFLYDAELPVVGSIFNNRNSPSQSLIDLVKPFQIAHNLFLNQAYVMAEDEILPFLMMDINSIPKLKGWKGEDGFIKWFEAVRSEHMAPIDTRPSVMAGANAGGQATQVVNLDATARMQSRFVLAENIRQMALRMIGMSDQRMGDIKAQETATGIQQAAQRSYVQTAGYFSRFYNFKKRCLKKTLDYAQFVQSTETDITASAINSDYSNAFLKLNGTELLTTQLHVYLSDSQQEQRNLEIARQLALENTTTASTEDRLNMATMDSLSKIREVVHNSNILQQQQAQQSQQLEQAKLDQQLKLQQDNHAFEAEQNRLKLESQEKQAYIKTFGYGNGAIQDSNEDGTADAFEYEKLSQASQGLAQKAQTDARKQELARLKLVTDTQHKEASLAEQAKERASREKIAQLKIQQSKILGDKSK